MSLGLSGMPRLEQVDVRTFDERLRRDPERGHELRRDRRALLERLVLLQHDLELQKAPEADDLVTQHHPSGFNLGVNIGEAAGQTVMHLHVHLIPRYKGDQPDPRGGIRRIFPDLADYWSPQDR